MTKWEYMVTDVEWAPETATKTECELDNDGKGGWELVSVSSTFQAEGDMWVRLYLKRALEDK